MGLLDRLLTEANTAPTGGRSSLLDRLQAETPSPDAEVDTSALPEVQTGGGPGLSPFASVEATGKRMLTGDPERLALSLARVRGIKIKRGKGGIPYAEIGSKRFSLNKPGLSFQDFAPFITAGTVGGIASAAAPATGLGAIAGEAVAGGASALGLQLADKASTGEVEITDPRSIVKGVLDPDTLLQTALGAGFGAGGAYVGRGARALLARAGTLLDSSGNLTVTARRALQEGGMKPADIDQISPDVLRRANASLRGSVNRRGQATPDVLRESVARVDTADTGIPLTKGERTGNQRQRELEVELQEGIRGPEASRYAAAEEANRRVDMGESMEGVAQRVAPGVTRQAPYAVGEDIGQAVRTSEQSAHDNVSAAYRTYEDLARRSGIVVSTGSTPAVPGGPGRPAQPAQLGRNAAQLLSDITDELLTEMPTLQPELAPKAMSLFRKLHADLSNPHVTPESLEGTRKLLNRMYSKATDNATDQEALRKIRNVLDPWIEQNMQRAAIAPGVPDGPMVMDSLREARRLAADRFSRFTPDSPKDVYGKIVQDVVNGHIQPDAILDRVLGTTGQFNNKGLPVYRKLQQALGSNDAVLADVRRQALLRIMGGSPDQLATSSKGAEGMANGIKRALEGSGDAYARQMFGTQGVLAMRQLERQLRRVVRPDELTNPSRSGFTMLKGIREAMRRAIGGSIGSTIGGTIGSIIPGPGSAIGATIGGLAGAGGASRAASKAGLRLAREAYRPAGGNLAAKATLSQLKLLPGQALTRSLPGLAGASARTMFDLDRPEEE